jgi:PTS system nitrogen regulatory IIA component
MNLLQSIHKESISVSLQSSTKEEVLEELLDLAMRSGQIRDRKATLKNILEREKKMSTGMHHGLAIPHAKTAEVDRLVAAVGLAPQGIEFESQDGRPSRIFILSISPANRAGPQIQFLAEISRILNSEARRQTFLSAETVDDLHALILQES